MSTVDAIARRAVDEVAFGQIEYLGHYLPFEVDVYEMRFRRLSDGREWSVPFVTHIADFMDVEQGVAWLAPVVGAFTNAPELQLA